MKPGFSSKARHRAGWRGNTLVQRAKLRTARSVFLLPTCRVMAMPSSRALYLPKGWTDDPARLKTTYVPDDVSFSTKPQLAAEMIERALAAGVPFRWVAGDSVYGVGDIERDLRQAGKGYVLGVNSNHWFASWGKPQRVI